MLFFFLLTDLTRLFSSGEGTAVTRFELPLDNEDEYDIEDSVAATAE